MSRLIFESNRYFTLFDVYVSHGQLLLRAQKNETYSHNIDIVFLAQDIFSCTLCFMVFL